MKSLIIASLAVAASACTAPDEPGPAAHPSAPSSAAQPAGGPSADVAVELVRIPATAHGDGFALTVAPPKGDAIERWGQCLARVADCYVPGEGEREREACLRATDAPPKAGENICPTSCRQAFERALRGDASVEAAVDASYKHGDCVAGFRAMSDDALRKLAMPGAVRADLGGAR
jgi:hypothetical protein